MSWLRPIVMSGPSGGGKSTLLKKLFVEYGDVLAFSVSHTTRKPRAGEQNGREYHFVDKDTFEKMLKENKLFEYAKFTNNYYGTSKKSVTDIQKSGRICVLDLEINGVKNIKASSLDARYVFIKTPSLDVLPFDFGIMKRSKRNRSCMWTSLILFVWKVYFYKYKKARLLTRGTESEESLARRLATAQEALDYANQPGSYDHVIINDNFDAAYEKLKGILIEDLEKLRREKSTKPAAQ